MFALDCRCKKYFSIVVLNDPYDLAIGTLYCVGKLYHSSTVYALLPRACDSVIVLEGNKNKKELRHSEEINVSKTKE
jgi:hypothetical protein